MNLDKLNRWLTLAANIGVVVGIYALVAELNHSSRLAEVSAFQNRMTEIQEANVQLSLSEDLAAILEKYESEGLASLSPSEFRRAEAWYSGVIYRMQGQYFQYQQGFLDRESIDNTLDYIAAQSWERWADFGITSDITITEWREEIEARLAGSR